MFTPYQGAIAPWTPDRIPVRIPARGHFSAKTIPVSACPGNIQCLR